MHINRTAAIIATLGLITFSIQANSDDEIVNSYVVSSSGELVTDTNNQCVRTTRKDSDKKHEPCGYSKPAPKENTEVVMTPTAVSRTAIVNEEISIAAAILFDFDSDVLSDDGKTIINERISRFSGYKKSNIDIQVIGHTDSVGPEDYNQKLSERRARSVADYIEKMKETPDASVEASGMGESQPIASNDTSEGRAKNRRVKILVSGTVQKEG